MVAFPNQSKIWISPIKSNIYLMAVIVLAAMLDIPWLLNAEIQENDYINISPNSTIAEFPYITVPTYFGKNIYPHLRHFQLTMNFVVPIPLLVIFNFLLYKSVSNYKKIVHLKIDCYIKFLIFVLRFPTGIKTENLCPVPKDEK